MARIPSQADIMMQTRPIHSTEHCPFSPARLLLKYHLRNARPRGPGLELVFLYMLISPGLLATIRQQSGQIVHVGIYRVKLRVET